MLKLLKSPRVLLAAAVTLAIAVPFAAGVTYADNSVQSATVTITDSGFSPAVVNLATGGTVAWVNQTNNVHTVTTTNSNPAPFDSGGLTPQQTFSYNFTLPGTYVYTSATDCLHANSTPGFGCMTYQINVGASPQPSGTPVTTPTAVPVPAGPPVVQNANIAITDSGFSPGVVTLDVGGTITWANKGNNVHTAVSGQISPGPPTLVNGNGPVLSSSPQPFDSGGLGPGQTFSVQFPVIGTYTYTSGTDCGPANSNNTVFNCSGPYTISVVNAPVGANAAAVAPPFSGPTILIKDSDGFEPNNLTIKAGQTVTWLNLGTTAHSVVGDPSVTPPFNSGGLGSGSDFTVTFQTPGTFHYSSSADSGRFAGTIVVQ